MADVNQLLMDEGLALPPGPPAAPPRDLGRIKRNVSKMIDGGAPSEDVDAYMASEGFKSPAEWKAATDPAPVSDGMAKSFAQGPTLGFGDEIGAGVRALAPKFSNWMMKPSAFEQSLGKTGQTVSEAPTYDQRYDEELAKERQAMKDFETQNPGLAMGSEIAGNVVSGIGMSALPGVGALFRGGSGVAGNVVKGGIGGAALGGAQGYGQGEGDGRLGGAMTGAAVGLGVGGALPVVAKGTSIAYEKLAPWALNKIASLADKFVKQVTPKSLSAAAPDGTVVPQDSLALTIADKARSAAGGIEEDAAMSRLARAIGSGNVDRARTKLADLGEDAFIADAGKGTERLANVGYLTSDDAADKYVKAYTDRDARTGKRFIGAMGENANVPNIKDAQDFLAAYKTQTGSELYDPVLRSGKLNVSEELTALQQRPAIKSALETVDGWAAEHGKTLTDAERFHMVKQALNSNSTAAFSSGKAINKKMVGDTASDWEKALWAANPAIKEADTAYAKVAPLSNPEKGNGYLERGYKFLKQGISPDAVDVSPAGLATTLADPTQAQAFRVGASNNLLETARSGAEPTRRLAKSMASNEILQEKLAQIYGPEQAAALIKRGGAELQYAAAKNRITAGSPTAERHVALARETALSPIPSSGGDIGRIWDFVKDTLAKTDKASEPVRSRLADLLANPNAAANAETLSLVEALLKRQASTPRLSSGIAGAAGGSFSSP